MVIRSALVAFFFLVIGCSRDWEGGGARITASNGSADKLMVAATRPSARSRGAAQFASLPDGGELLAYPDAGGVRHDGAYTWHRTELSEVHALRAVVDRKLRITTPSGERLTFDYERHVEHPSGDWTWIGRLEGGDTSDEIILTFGEQAAFGTIAQPGKEPLRLTVNDGISWLVETDGTAISAIDNAATRPRGPDYRIPPKIGRSGTTAVSAGASKGTSSEGAAAATAATVVDVVLGYTSGFAAGLGGQSQALTRLNYLVDVTNQAYVNSQVNAQVRLVHALQVDYPDTTTNDLALEQLTGFRAPSTPVSPAPAFAALRAARDQYGADLVALVRKFYDPEQDGCGIAWLIGGSRSGIDARDEFFGYSVVSDGTDVGTDGKNYFCRDETLAHELGHNMGSQHDRATATDDGELKYGVFSYSFGHKTTAVAGNFYTIMAYGDTGQTRYRIFSNPRTSYCGGFVCGVEFVADNGRSLNQTIPIVATFRATVVGPPVSSARNDLDGDGQSDLLWRNLSNGANAIWKSANSATQQPINGVTNLSWKVAGVADFDGNGKRDILWRNESTGINVIWKAGNAGTSQAVTGLAVNWTVAGTGDFDGDGKGDILWRNTSTGANRIWMSANSLTEQAVATLADLAWKVAAIEDFDGDGRDDIVWRHASIGANAMWKSANSATAVGLTRVSDLSWRIVGAGDFDGDGAADLVWRHLGAGANAIWKSANSATPQPVTNISNTSWTIVAVCDYDGDGMTDLVWRNTSTGANALWKRANSANSLMLTGVSNQAWVIVP